MNRRDIANAKIFVSPDEDEDEETFMDRCISEATDDNPDMTRDEIEQECEIAWEDRSRKHWRKQLPAVLKSVKYKARSGAGRGTEFILSDETPDRLNDVLSASGWDLENFKKNPIALFNHDAGFPIGRWTNLRVEDDSLRGQLELAPRGTSDRTDEIRKLVEAGILRAVSVGFQPIEMSPRLNDKGDLIGIYYFKQELIETSLVAVPANQNALAVAKSLNISPATIDIVFAGTGARDAASSRRTMAGPPKPNAALEGKSAMSLSQRITDTQQSLVERRGMLATHWANVDNSNVSDADVQKSADLNAEIVRLEKQLDALTDSERLLAATTANGDRSRAIINSPAVVINGRNGGDAANYSTVGKNQLNILDYIARAGTCLIRGGSRGKDPQEMRRTIYGEDEATRFFVDLVCRAASAPAMTTVTGWAQELVQQTYTALMPTLMPKAVLTRLGAKGLSLSFGRAGKIVIPTRSRTPSIAGSFVGEGMAIPVRQGAFTSQTLTPKKCAVISTWTREMDDHSTPGIEGIIRESIQVDTTIAVDSVLLDANAATAIRPAGLFFGVTPSAATAGGGIAAVIGDLKNLIGALSTGTFGNIREPVWLMNPAEVLSLSLVNVAATGIFPFKDEVGRGSLLNIPIIDSSTVPAKTIALVDAADFVVVGGEAPRFALSDSATLHMEDSAPADLVGAGSPGVVAAPQRSLFQTDSIGLRMVMPLNWAQRRAGTVALVQNVTW